MFKSALRLGVDTSVLTKQFARADDLFARDKQWFGETIQTIAFGLIWLDCIDPRMAVLCCAVLCCAVLCCAVLCCAPCSVPVLSLSEVHSRLCLSPSTHPCVWTSPDV